MKQRGLYQHKREPLQLDELKRLEDACRSGRERLIVFTLADTGLRVAEFAALTRPNIDFQLHRITLTGKGGKRRVLKMTPRVRVLLESHFAIHDTVGMSKRTVQRLIFNLARRVSIPRPTSAHIFRHTFAVECLRRGVSLAALQKLLGHESILSTAVYLNLAPEAALAEFEDKF